MLVCLGDFAVGTFGLCFLFRLLFRVFEFVNSVGFLWFFSIEVFCVLVIYLIVMFSFDCSVRV